MKSRKLEQLSMALKGISLDGRNERGGKASYLCPMEF